VSDEPETPPPWQENPRGLLKFVTGSRPDWSEAEAWQAIHAAHSAGMPFDRLAGRLVAIAFRHKPGEPPSSPLELRDEASRIRPQAPAGSLDPRLSAALRRGDYAAAWSATHGGAVPPQRVTATGPQPALTENDNQQEAS